MKKVLFIFINIALFASLTSVCLGATTDQPLLYSGDVTYLGAFRLPQGTYGASSYNYSGRAVTPYNDPVTGKYTLFMEGHDWDSGTVGQMEIPATFSKNVNWSSLPQASVLQDFRDIADGKWASTGQTYTQAVFGMLPYHGRLIVAATSWYDSGCDQYATHGVSTFNLSSSNDFQGFYSLDADIYPRSLGGYMTTIPNAWQSLFGGPALTGNSALSIIGCISSGPAATVFDPDDLGVQNPVPATNVLHYPLEHYLVTGNATDNTFSYGSLVKGIAFPEGFRSVLFIGRQTLASGYCYGPGTDDPNLHGLPTEGGTWCYDLCDESKGGHGYPYYHSIWAYDANDLLQVKNGTKQAWEIQPYATWQLDDMDTRGCAGIRGAGYDPDTRRLFITQLYGEEPRVDVYQIAEGTPAVCGDGTCNGTETCSSCSQDCGICDTQAPSTPTNLQATAQSYSQINLTWTASTDNNSVSGYKIYRNGSQAGTSIATNYSDTGLSGSTAYTYRVSAYDSAGNESGQSTQAQATTPVAPALIGHDTIGASTDSSNANFINTTRYTAPQTGSITSISVYVSSPISTSPNNQFQVAIYANNSGTPGSLIAQSQSGTLTGNTWNTLPVTATLQSGTDYWLAYNTNAANSSSNNTTYDTGSSGQTTWRAQTFGTWPNPFGTPAGSSNTQTSIYASYATSLVIRADVDQNSSINTTDALLTLRNSLGLSMVSTAWQASATTGDVNCDGSSNSTDALLILRYSLGLSMGETSWCE